MSLRRKPWRHLLRMYRRLACSRESPANMRLHIAFFMLQVKQVSMSPGVGSVQAHKQHVLLGVQGKRFLAL